MLQRALAGRPLLQGICRANNALTRSPTLALQYSSGPSKTALVGKLRKETQAPLNKVKEALEKHQYDYAKALEHVLSTQANVSSKLASRIAKDGAIGVLVSPCFSKATMVEVNCETDFVARSQEFAAIVSHVRESISAEENGGKSVPSKMFFEVGTERWTDDETVKMGIGKLREKISVRRAIKGSSDATLFGGYAHGYQEGMGRIGALVALNIEGGKAQDPALGKLAKQIAQQVVGFGPTTIEVVAGADEGTALMGQDFLFGGGKVAEVLKAAEEKAGCRLKVSEFVRFECGEGIHKEEGNFAEEVRQQAARSGQQA
ncbi:hypothetical protein HDU67_000489 [Dinochytrium kinnereticum]|nr:hypothetical protein HDU67_000489 [Dinochytrium kinnereticum]